MIGSRTIRRRVGDEEEKPFWISFADLMSALMVLFLVVMSAALVSITKAVNDQVSANDRRESEIEQIVKELGEAAKRFDGITVNAERRVIDFGDRARFAVSSSYLDDGQRRRLRSFVPEILVIADSALGRRVLKRVVVEGFTDKTGKYLENLNLSLQRSARVLCSMFEPPALDEVPFLDAQRQQIQELFLVPEPLERYMAKSPKLSWLIEQLGVIRSRGEKAIIFCEFREIQRLLQHYIAVALRYLAGTADERQYQVMSHREQWFRVVMGQDEVARLITPDAATGFPLPEAVASGLSFKLEIEQSHKA